MAEVDIARALRDKDYFNSLTADQKARVKNANPVGDVDLDDNNLDSVSGGLGGGREDTANVTGTSTGCKAVGGIGIDETDPPSCTCNC